MKRRVRILIVEDRRDDAELLAHALEDAQYELDTLQVSDEAAMTEALQAREWDLICTDHQMPNFSSRGALRVLRESGKDIPLILVSGSVGEMEAVEILREGARDYILKDNIHRLPPAVDRELRESRNRQEKRIAQEALGRSLKELSDIKFAIDQASILATTDANGVITYVNDKFCQISQYSREELLGKTHKVVNSGLHPKEFFADLWGTISAGRIWEGEIRNRAKGGSYYWVHTFIVPFLDSDARPYQYVAIRTDITNRKIAEEQLREAVRIRDDFLSVASHELRTPLTSLKLQAQSMLRMLSRSGDHALSREQIVRMVEQTDKQANRLGRLVDDMLDISRIRVGKLPLDKQQVDLCELVAEVHERMAAQFEAAGCQAAIHVCEPAVGVLDRFRIEQVVMNLFTNAIRYGQGRPIAIRVYQSGSELLFSVRDEGIGVAPENQRRIFDRFERAISANEISGLGLGLYIAREIVESHGGRIWVESAIGKGATFFVELPKVAQPP